MDTGWLLVGVAGVTGGLALVCIGAGVATAPLLLPLGLLLTGIAYLAWATGSSRVVATVYEGVGDTDRAAAGGVGHPGSRTDPDGNWRSAADGGRAAGREARDSGHDEGPGGDTGAAASASASGRGAGPGAGTRDGLGRDGERIWDAHERDRVGGWDDWGERAGADHHWHAFERERADRTGGDERGKRGRTADGRDQRRGAEARTGARRRARRHGPGDERHTRSRRRERRESRPPRAQRARDLLGVSPDADAGTIREAYRERVKEVHPDRGGDPDRFKRVQWAYDYLTDE